MLGGIEGLGIDLDFAGVGQSELELELRFSGAQREVDSVAILIGLGRGLGGDGLSVGSAGLDLFELGAGRQEEFEVVIVHLRLGWRRGVVDDEEADALHGSGVGLKADDIGGDAEAGNFRRDVVDVHVDGVGAGRGHLVIGDALMDGADEVGTGRSVEGEAEFAGAVGLGGGGNIHAVGEVDEKDFVSGGGLVGGAVGDGAS